MQQFREVSRTKRLIVLKHIQATLYLIRSEMGYVLKWEASAVFPGEVLSGGDRVPREQVLQQSSEFSGEVG